MVHVVTIAALCLGLVNARKDEPQTQSLAPHSTWITEVIDGVETSLNANTFVIEGDWTLLITLAEPVLPSSFITFTQALNTYLIRDPDRQMKSQGGQLLSTNYQSRLANTVLRTNTLNRWWNPGKYHPRTRRGLLNLVGHGFQFLFGTATEADVRDVQDQIEAVQHNQQLLTVNVQRFTTVLNYAQREINTTRAQVNHLTESFNRLLAFTLATQATNSELLRYLSFKSEMDLLFYHLDQFVDAYLRIFQQWLTRKANVEAGRLTENILPPMLLHQILQPASSRQAIQIKPYQWYYEHLSVIPMWTESSLVYKVRLPVVHVDNWHAVKFTTWPVPLGDTQAELKLPSHLLRNTRTGELDLSPKCIGARPLVCRRGLLTNAINYPCVSSLLANTPRYANECIITVSNRIPIDVVHPRHNNEYLLVTRGGTLRLRCANVAEQLYTAVSGVYLLHIPYPCTVKTEKWSLTATYERTLNLTLNPKMPEINVKLNFNNIIKNNTAMITALAPLDPLKPFDISEISFEMMYRPLPYGKTHNNTWFWYLFFLIFLPTIATGLLLMRKFRRSAFDRMFGKCIAEVTPPNENKKPEQTPPASAPSSVTNVVYQFHGENEPRNLSIYPHLDDQHTPSE